MTGHVRQRSPGSFELRWRAGGKVRTETIKATSTRAAEKELAKRVASNQALNGRRGSLSGNISRNGWLGSM
jgi:hypothetical protein